MKKFSRFISEAFDKPYEYDFKRKGKKTYQGKFTAGDNSLIVVNCDHYVPGNEWTVEFFRNGSQSVTGEGDAMRIFATVMKIIERFLKVENPYFVRFAAMKENEDKKDKQSREKLYSRLVKRFAGKMGYNSKENSASNGTEWELTRKPSENIGRPVKKMKKEAYEVLKNYAANQYITEAFDKPYPFKLRKFDDMEYEADARLPNGQDLEIQFSGTEFDHVTWDVIFTVGGSLLKTGGGDAMRIFATVIAAMEAFIKKEKPQEISFSAEKEGKGESSREKLYASLIKRFAGKMGYKVDTTREYTDSTVYHLKKR